MKKFNRVFTVLIFIFLYVPMAVLIVASFDTGKSLAGFEGFTMQQYVRLFKDRTLLKLLGNSILLSVLASSIATVFGTVAAVAYGIGLKHQISPENWPTGNNGWFSLLFQNPEILQKVQEYWQNHHSAFEAVIDSVDSTVKYLTPAAKNEYKRWPILGEKFWIFVESFKRYEETADSLKDWIRERIAWLDAELLSPPSESAAYQ